jgi:sugar phosphate isomerase/epimerase
MYKGFSSGLLGFRDRSIKDDISVALKYGYEGIQLNVVKDSTAMSPSELSELLSENRLKAGGFNLALDFRKDKDTYEAGIKALPSYCEFAKKSGFDRCTTYIMPFSDTLDYKSNFKLHTERLTPAAKILEEYEIKLGFEFVGPSTLRKGKAYEFIHDLEGINELINAVGTKNLGYLLDAFHWDTAGQAFDDFKKIPGNESVVMVHINDGVKGRTLEEQLDQERELPGATGIIRLEEFMKGLKDLNYDGPVFIEPFSKPLREMAFEDAVQKAKASMDKVWI